MNSYSLLIRKHFFDSDLTALFSLELSDTLIAFCERNLVVLAATKKAKLLQTLSDNLGDEFEYKVHVLTRDKTDKDIANFAKVLPFLCTLNKLYYCLFTCL